MYVLSNPAMPGLLKIGQTRRAIEERLAELSSATGVPQAFRAERVFEVERPEACERRVHAALQDCRVGGREFFSISLEEALPRIEEIVRSVDAPKPVPVSQAKHATTESSREAYRRNPNPINLPYHEQVRLRSANFDKEFAPVREGVEAGRLCSCSICAPWALWAGHQPPAYSPAHLCDCNICGGSGLRLGVCCCPVCSPMKHINGGDQVTPFTGALGHVTGVMGASGLSVSASLEKRKAEQSRLQAALLEKGDSAVGLLSHVIAKAKEDPRYLKTGARAAIDLLRLALPVGWDREKDPNAAERVLGEFRATMKAMGEVMQKRIDAAEKGIELPEFDLVVGGKEKP